jgi:hypothetical protein
MKLHVADRLPNERLHELFLVLSSFDPPGQMSAGLTCEMLVTFKPMINEDLVGQVNFMAQTGVFSVPLKCTTKKCDVSVGSHTVICEIFVSVLLSLLCLIQGFFWIYPEFRIFTKKKK